MTPLQFPWQKGRTVCSVWTGGNKDGRLACVCFLCPFSQFVTLPATWSRCKNATECSHMSQELTMLCHTVFAQCPVTGGHKFSVCLWCLFSQIVSLPQRDSNAKVQKTELCTFKLSLIRKGLWLRRRSKRIGSNRLQILSGICVRHDECAC